MTQRTEEQRFQDAIDDAEQAFWCAFGKHYPEVKTGDLSPLVAIGLQQQMEFAAQTWLETNRH